jgi:hypothetical protein
MSVVVNALSLSQEVGLGLGAQAGEAKLREVFTPGQKPPHGGLIRPLRVRIMVLGKEEFLPGEACRPPCPLDLHRQRCRVSSAGTLSGDALTKSLRTVSPLH